MIITANTAVNSFLLGLKTRDMLLRLFQSILKDTDIASQMTEALSTFKELHDQTVEMVEGELAVNGILTRANPNIRIFD